MLKKRRDSFRSGYRAWRKGGANGARGEVSGVATLSGSSSSAVLQNLGRAGKRSIADLVGVYTGVAQGKGADHGRVEPPNKAARCEPPHAVEQSAATHPHLADGAIKQEQMAPYIKTQTQMAPDDMSSIAEVLTMMKSGAANVSHEAEEPAPRTVGKYRVAAKRRRKSTDTIKRQLTGVLYVLCHSELMPCVEAVEKSRLPQLGVPNPEGRFALIVKFGREATVMKEKIAVGISAILNALSDSQAEREPLKWDTLQRDILWKYQRRIQSDSLYVYQEPTSSARETIEDYGRQIVEGLAPRTVEDVLREPIRRHAEAANIDFSPAPAQAPRLGPLVDTAGGGSEAAARIDSAHEPDLQPPAAAVVSHLVPALAPTSASGGRQQPQPLPQPLPPSQQAPLSTVLICGVQGCTYSTVHQRYLDQHRRGHAGVKPFTCHWPGCTYACSGKGHLVRHIRVHTVRGSARLPHVLFCALRAAASSIY
jgi:flagellar motor component MotA